MISPEPHPNTRLVAMPFIEILTGYLYFKASNSNPEIIINSKLKQLKFYIGIK